MKRYIPYLFLALAIAACSRMGELDALHKAKAAIDKKQYDEAITYLEIIVKEYPEGMTAPEATYYLASIQQNEKKDLKKALELYNRLHTKYPKSEPAPKALFTEAFLYANQLNNIEKAKALYKEFLDRYPTHSMAASARTELNTLGIDPNVILESLQQQATADSAVGKRQ